MVRPLLALGCAVLLATLLPARDWIVAPSGGDFTTIQAALDVALPGDRVLVRDKSGGYAEKLVFPRSGSAGAGPITLMADAGHAPVVTGAGVSGQHMILIQDRDWIVVEGLELRDNLGVSDGGGVRISGSCSEITIRGNRIHEMRGQNAMGITVYGFGATTGVRIDGNEVYDCDPAPSEAITLNGDVSRFEVTDNWVHDVDNIGIDFIGGETWVHPTAVARDGVCRGNLVERARSSYGGGWGAGIYVDGGRDILIEDNVVRECDLGIEVGAENKGFNATGIVVRDNLIHGNDKAGLVFGGYAKSVGRVKNCSFRNNSCVENDTSGQFLGELWIQWASDNTVADNVFVAGAQQVMMYSGKGNQNNTLNHNLWFAPGAAASAEWVWRKQSYNGFAAFQAGSGQGADSQWADPRFVDPALADFRLLGVSPAVDAGDPLAAPGGLDLGGMPRLLDGLNQGALRVDQGAHEFGWAKLGVSGQAVPGGSLQIDLQGISGATGSLFGGLPGEETIAPYGILFLDRFDPAARTLYSGFLPWSGTLTVPPGLQPGTQVVLQGVMWTGVGGQLSNPVFLTIG